MIGVLAKERSVAHPGFNRWLVPPAAIAVHLCIGQAYALSVFYDALSHLGGGNNEWGPTELSAIFTLAIVVLGISAAVAARWLNRAGPRAVIFVAACCFGGGLLISALGVRLHQISLLYFGYGVVGGVGLGLGYVAPISVLIEWFPDRRGLATGLAVMGFGGGAMIAAPLSAFLIACFGNGGSKSVAESFAAMGIIYFLLMAIGAFAIRTPAPGTVKSLSVAAEGSMTVEAAVRTPQFYFLWFVLAANVVAGIGVLGQAPEMLRENLGTQVTPAAVAGFVGLLSLFNMAGRVLYASASDHLGRRNTFTILLLLSAVLYASASFVSARASAAVVVLQFAILTSLYGGVFAALPAYVADCFGPKFVGGIHGRLLTAWSAGMLGSVSLGALRDHEMAAGATRSAAQGTILEIVAALLLAGLVCNWLIKPCDRTGLEPAAGSHDEESWFEPSAAMRSRAHVDLIGPWALVGVPIAWGIVMTIAQASELSLSWRLALTLLPLVLGGAVTVGFHYLDKSRFTVRGVVGPYFTAVALLFGLYASLMATEVWQRSARSTALLRAEITALDSALRIAEGVQPRDRTVRLAVQAELASITAGDLHTNLGVTEVPLQRFYAIAADGAFFTGAPSANAAFYKAIEEVHATKLERDTLEETRLGASKLFTLLMFGFLTQIAIAICHAGNSRALGAAVMLFSIAFAASVGILELMDDRIPVALVPAAMMAP